MNLSITEQLQYVTVRIEVELNNGLTSTGTGFFFRLCERDKVHIPVVLTNTHVVAGGKTGKFRMTIAHDDNTPDNSKHLDIVIEDIEQRFICHPDPTIDLCALPIASLLMEAKKRNEKLFYIALDRSFIPTEQDESELTAVEDILMVGYPNGIWDSVNNLPVFRKGITATHPAKKYNGRDEFMIDAACFPGSSGSPVILYNIGSYAAKSGGTIIGSRIKFLGVLYAGPQHTASGEIQIIQVPTQNVPVAISRIPNNLGNVIKAKRILDFDALFEKDIANNRLQLIAIRGSAS
jgi:hypothetical protein